jgi:hypothetical protein
MLFLNSWLLLGVLGVSIPVIIHLLNRRHAKVVDWGAMRFLLDSIISRRRRVLLEEILLLAVRCLLMALVALALARPFVSASSRIPWVVVLPAALLAVVLFGVSFALWRYPVWRRRVVWAVVVLVALVVGAAFAERQLNLKRFGGGGSRDVALVLDGSSSMTMTIDGESNFERAVKEAETYIESAPRGYSFSLIIGGSVPNVLVSSPTPDRKQLQDLLREAVPVQGTMQALDTLAVAATTLARGDTPSKQIVMIGDGQSVGWRTGEPDLWAYLQEAFTRLPTPPQVIWRRLSMPQTIRNATLAGVTLSRDIVGTDRDVRIDVTIANTGGETITPQDVRLTIGDKVFSDRSLAQLQPGVSATVSFRHRFERAGAEVIKAQVIANDEMPGDDEALHVVHVMDQLKVLVVDAATTSRFLGRPGAFVTLALKPVLQELSSLTEGAAAQEFLVQPELTSLYDLTREGDIGDARVVVLVDVPQLPPVLANRLATFVDQGGGLLVVAGAGASSAFYNDWRGSGGPVMPLQLDTLMRPAETNRPSLALNTFSHSALKPLITTDLGVAAFASYWQSGEGDSVETRIAARFDNGDPFISERAYGRGVVLQVNAPLDSSAGNMVSRQGFVPLVHELVYYLARPVAANLNLPPSRGATLQLGVSGAGNKTGSGLRAEYFNTYLAKRGGTVRIDASVSKLLKWPGELPRIENGMGIRWTGSIALPVSGSYVFETSPSCNLQILVNGHKVMAGARKRAEVEFAKGIRYDLDIEFRARPNSDTRRVHLDFSGPNLVKQAIPTEFLSPETSRSGADKTPGIETTIKGPASTLPARFITAANGSMALRIDQNLVPGLYTAQVPPSLIESLKSLLTSDGTLLFGVAVDGEESQLTPLSTEETYFIGGFVNLVVASSAEDVMSALVGKAFGQELWRALALAAFVLLFLEVVLTRWIAVQRREGVDGEINFEDANKPSATFRTQLNNLKTGTR